jgi:hypothetical protein
LYFESLNFLITSIDLRLGDFGKTLILDWEKILKIANKNPRKSEAS